MNRRGFLKTLIAAPIAIPAAVKAAPEWTLERSGWLAGYGFRGTIGESAGEMIIRMQGELPHVSGILATKEIDTSFLRSDVIVKGLRDITSLPEMALVNGYPSVSDFAESDVAEGAAKSDVAEGESVAIEGPSIDVEPVIGIEVIR